MHITSFAQHLRVALLLSALSLPGLAHARAAVAVPAVNVAQVTSGSQGAGTPIQEKAVPQPKLSGISRASILPDPSTLLPVAAVVGFSFLFGGLVCTWKARL